MTLHPYQEDCVRRIMRPAMPGDGIGLFLEPGLGKTTITLTALARMGKTALVVAPKAIAEATWPEEARKWTPEREVAVATGSPAKRLKALASPAPMAAINYENLPWLVAQIEKGAARWHWDYLVLDELSLCRGWSTQRMKALKFLRGKAQRVIGLTGTPAPKGASDLFAEAFVLDGGKRLGRTLTAFRQRYMTQPIPALPQVWKDRPGALRQVESKIADIAIAMKAEDYLRMPKKVSIVRRVTIPDKAMAEYQAFKRRMVSEIEGGQVTASSKAAMLAKCVQMAGGAVYGDDGKPRQLHHAKLDALKAVVERQGGDPIIVFYWFQCDSTIITMALKDFHPRELKTAKDVDDWNAGKIPVLLVQPLRGGYGLNLQRGGRSAVWFTLPWDFSVFQQACDRIYRQGQEKPVVIQALIASGTADEAVLRLLRAKKAGQDELYRLLREEA